MGEILCVCGHPQHRHTFETGFCTVSEKATIGVGYKTCHCPAFRDAEEKVAEPKLESEQRMDRIELAVSTMAEKLEMPEIGQILLGGPLEGVSDERVFGGDHYPAAERQAEQGPEVSGSRDEQDQTGG